MQLTLSHLKHKKKKRQQSTRVVSGWSTIEQDPEIPESWAGVRCSRPHVHGVTTQHNTTQHNKAPFLCVAFLLGILDGIYSLVIRIHVGCRHSANHSQCAVVGLFYKPSWHLHWRKQGSPLARAGDYVQHIVTRRQIKVLKLPLTQRLNLSQTLL